MSTSTSADQVPEGSALGTWGVEAPGRPNLHLTADGRFTGTDGCNRMFGSWTEDANGVSFSEVGMTRMACPDVDTWLERLHTGRVHGQELSISDETGSQIGTLERSG